jgi:hypothetical protein
MSVIEAGTRVFYARNAGEADFPWHRARVVSYDPAAREYVLNAQRTPTVYWCEEIRVPQDWVQRETSDDCIHEEMDYTGKPLLATHPIPQTWLAGSPVIPGSVWCWSHGRHETVEVKA